MAAIFSSVRSSQRMPMAGPQLLPQGGLRGQHLGRAASITIMTGHGTSHAPILPYREEMVAAAVFTAS
jgi:hypothetical protein